MSVNKLILGDNLEILKRMESESVDLIYLDPPFFSNRNYAVIWGDAGEVRSFQDRWSGRMDHREIEFIATGQSEAGVEFYSWNFNYDSEKGFKADVMIDKEGKQTAKFKAGLHNIAVKVVDNDGLESVEVVKLKVNGVVERAE